MDRQFVLEKEVVDNLSLSNTIYEAIFDVRKVLEESHDPKSIQVRVHQVIPYGNKLIIIINYEFK